MKTYFKSELEWLGFKDEDVYYVKYLSPTGGWEFWTDDPDEYEKKVGFVQRHITYTLLDNREPICYS